MARSLLILFALTFCAASIARPTCGPFQHPKHLLTAFYLADKSLTTTQLNHYKESIRHLDVLDYWGAKISQNGNTLTLPRKNLTTLKKWMRKNKINTKVILSISGWETPQGHLVLLTQAGRTQFINALLTIIKDKTLGVSGIDLDWEGVLTSNPVGVTQFPELVKQVSTALTAEKTSICLSIDLPVSVYSAKVYPDPETWTPYVNWANVMAYNYYGNSPGYTELDGTLGTVTAPYGGPNPENISPSIVNTLNYYKQHGASKQQLLVVVPFYAQANYTYYAGKNYQFGLRQPVVPNTLVIPIRYSTIYRLYGIYGDTKPEVQIHQYTFSSPRGAIGKHAYWITTSVLPLDGLTNTYRFISYPDPRAIGEITDYVFKHHYRGLSAWILNGDLPYQNPHSLLRTIDKTLQKQHHRK